MKFPSPSSIDSVVAITGLSRRFGAKIALDDVSLYVPKGGVFGLVGENCAGKTTLIKHILGLQRAETGTVQVFGHNPVASPVEVLGRIGYLSELPDLPGWMRVAELLRYMKAFYPKWDTAYAAQMLDQFGLNPAQRLGTLSKGQTAKAGLLVAQAHRPDLLLLDEPSSGLDPLVRRDILEAVIRTVADEGRTVFFSSHLLEEIERVSDHVAMVHHGKIVFCGPLDEIKAQHRRLVLSFENTQAKPPVITGALNVSGMGKEWTVICKNTQNGFAAAATQLGARVVGESAPSFNEIFVAHAASSAA